MNTNKIEDKTSDYSAVIGNSGKIWSDVDNATALVKGVIESQALTLMTPNMTSNNSNGYIVTSGATTVWSPLYQAFDGVKNIGIDNYLSFQGIHWVKLQLPSAITVCQYNVYAGFNQSGSERSPRNWTFKGSNNDSNWDTLNTQSSQTFTAGGQERSYTISSPGSYLYYMLDITAVNGGIQDTVIGEISLYFMGPSYAVKTFTIS